MHYFFLKFIWLYFKNLRSLFVLIFPKKIYTTLANHRHAVIRNDEPYNFPTFSTPSLFIIHCICHRTILLLTWKPSSQEQKKPIFERSGQINGTRVPYSNFVRTHKPCGHRLRTNRQVIGYWRLNQIRRAVFNVRRLFRVKSRASKCWIIFDWPARPIIPMRTLCFWL